MCSRFVVRGKLEQVSVGLMDGLFVCALKKLSGTISKISGPENNFLGTIIFLWETTLAR